MAYKPIAVLTALLLLVGIPLANALCLPKSDIAAITKHTSCCTSIYPESRFDSLSLQQLGQEFQRLRGLHCRDCDYYGSDLAAIMSVLERKLVGLSRKKVKRLMGDPDEKQPRKLIYYWRGQGHDYLIISFWGIGKGAATSWYHAYE